VTATNATTKIAVKISWPSVNIFTFFAKLVKLKLESVYFEIQSTTNEKATRRSSRFSHSLRDRLSKSANFNIARLEN